jgi:hypothetical protein
MVMGRTYEMEHQKLEAEYKEFEWR